MYDTFTTDSKQSPFVFNFLFGYTTDGTTTEMAVMAHIHNHLGDEKPYQCRDCFKIQQQH
jgi:hypothetical protein